MQVPKPLLLSVLFLFFCAGITSLAPSASAEYTLGDQLADTAAECRNGRPWWVPAKCDCSGLVNAIVARVGLDHLKGNTWWWWWKANDAKWVHSLTTPRRGDLVFFDETYKKSGCSSRINCALTHIAMVVDVDSWGTATLVHWSHTARGPAFIEMNLRYPDLRDHNGRSLNSPLAMPGHPPLNSKRLSGELHKGFATIRR